MSAPNATSSAPRRLAAHGPAAAPVDPRDFLRFLHSDVRLTDRELETITGTHPVTLRRWRSKRDSHAPLKTGRLDDLRFIVGVLIDDGVFSPEEAGRFLRSRNKDLDQRPPLEWLVDTDDKDRREKEFRRVLEVAEALVGRLLVTTN